MSNKSISAFDLAPGKTVAQHFTIVRPNRQSDLTTTYEVRDERNGQCCELVLFPAVLFEHREQLDGFCEAWRTWSGVQSPYVNRVLEVVRFDDDNVLLVSEFPKGRSLRAALDEVERLPQARVRALGVQLLDGLMAVHAAGLVHGDVKPSTVRVVDDGDDWQAQLIDGGVTTALWNAKHLGERTALIGTPFYAPVEQFGGDSPDVASDVYNVATVLFELVTGVIPWPGSNFPEIFQAKLEKAPPSMGRRAPEVSVDPDFERVVVTGLLTDKRERYGSALAFRDALAELSDPEI